MLENVRSALRGIWAHKLRSFLTVLGVIIGIASIIAIVSIVEGTNRKLERSLVGSGNNVTTVSVSEDGWPYEFSGGVPSGLPVLPESLLDQVRSLSGVEAATAYRVRQGWRSVFYQDRSLSNGYVVGVADD